MRDVKFSLRNHRRNICKLRWNRRGRRCFRYSGRRRYRKPTRSVAPLTEHRRRRRRIVWNGTSSFSEASENCSFFKKKIKIQHNCSKNMYAQCACHIFFFLNKLTVTVTAVFGGRGFFGHCGSHHTNYLFGSIVRIVPYSRRVVFS